MANIAVFGSGTIKPSSRDFKLAYELGFLLAKSGFTVLNGGYAGSMLASAVGAKKAGGATIGVTTDEFADLRKNNYIDREVRKPTWRERMLYLMDQADGYVVLDGGTGTLTELMVSWEMNNKHIHPVRDKLQISNGVHTKPLVVLGRRMKTLIRLLKRNPEVIVPKQFHIANSPEAAVRFLRAHLGSD